MNQICIHTEDTDLAEAFEIFFEGKYQIKVLGSAEDATRHLSMPDCQCKVFIYDAMNPSNNDINYLKRLKKAHADLKIVICYVYFEEKQISESLLASQVDAIIYKPFDLAEVDRQLQKLTAPPVSEITVRAVSAHNSV